jgi:hypothetical protein
MSELVFQGTDTACGGAWPGASDHSGHGTGIHPPNSMRRVVKIFDLSPIRQRPELMFCDFAPR